MKPLPYSAGENPRSLSFSAGVPLTPGLPLISLLPHLEANTFSLGVFGNLQPSYFESPLLKPVDASAAASLDDTVVFPDVNKPVAKKSLINVTLKPIAQDTELTSAEGAREKALAQQLQFLQQYRQLISTRQAMASEAGLIHKNPGAQMRMLRSAFGDA